MLYYFNKTENIVEKFVTQPLYCQDDYIEFDSIGKVICINDCDTKDLTVNKIYHIVSETTELYGIVTNNGKTRKVWKRRFLTLDDNTKIFDKITQLMTFNSPTIGTYLTQDKVYVCYYYSDNDTMLQVVNNTGKLMFWLKEQFTNFIIQPPYMKHESFYSDDDDDDLYEDGDYSDDDDDDDSYEVDNYGNCNCSLCQSIHNQNTIEASYPSNTLEEKKVMFYVECVDASDRKYLTEGVSYPVYDVIDGDYKIKDNRGTFISTFSWRFSKNLTMAELKPIENTPKLIDIDIDTLLSLVDKDNISDIINKLLKMYK